MDRSHQLYTKDQIFHSACPIDSSTKAFWYLKLDVKERCLVLEITH